MFAELLAQRVAVDAEKLGGADLVAVGGGKALRKEWPLYLGEDAAVEPRWRQSSRTELAREVPLDESAQ